MPTVSLISSIPSFVSKEENDTLSSSTPSSFSDLPPILAHKEETVSITLDPPVNGFTTDDAAQGTLYILSSVLVFMSTTGRGFRIEYPSITLHAISRQDGNPSIYCQLDEETEAATEQLSHTNLNGNATAEHEAEEGGDGDNEEDYSPMRELRIIPQNPEALEPIFEALSKCASLHPDADDSEENDNDAFVDQDTFEVFNGDEEQELSEIGRAALDHLESIIYNRFERGGIQDGANGRETQGPEQESTDGH